jgi:hypothetical protein
MPAGRDARQLQVIDPVLTQIARQYRPHGFVYNDVCSTIPVDTLSGQYPVYDERYWFQNEQDNKISDRGETPEVEFAWSTDTYLCEDYGFKVSITPRERQQAGSVGGQALRLESSKTEFLMQQMANAREKRLANMLRKVGTGNGALTSGAAATTAFATSTVIESDFKTAKTAVYNLTGLTPNVAIVPYLKAYDMATNVELRKIWLYQVNSENFIKLGADDQGEDIFLPRWFQGCRLLVPKGALAQTAHEGAAKSLTEVWGTSVRFLYVAPSGGGWGIPSTVYQFSHEVISGSGRSGPGAVVDRWSENDPRKDVIRALECISEKVTAPDTGYEMTGV